MSERGTAKTNCGICLERFTDPKILPCFHTFCLKCLDDNLRTTCHSERFTCPMCRAPTLIPQGGLKCFQTNFYVEANNVESKLEFDCDACGRRKTASHKCVECVQNFCDSCSEVHTRMTSSREHNLISYPPMRCIKPADRQAIAYCTSHTTQEITSVCKNCGVLVCNICKTTSHINHNLREVSTEAEDKRTRLRDLIDTAENNLREIESDIGVVKCQAESKHAFFNNEKTLLRQERDSVIANIQKTFQTFENEIVRLNNEQKRVSNEIIDNQVRKTESFKYTVDYSRAIADAYDDIDILGDFDKISADMEEIVVTPIPVVSGHELMGTVEQCTSWLVKLRQLNRSKPQSNG